MESMERQRFKEALRKVMDIAQEGNGFLQRAEPWKYLKSDLPSEREKALKPLSAAWHSLGVLDTHSSIHAVPVPEAMGDDRRTWGVERGNLG